MFCVISIVKANMTYRMDEQIDEATKRDGWTICSKCKCRTIVHWKERCIGSAWINVSQKRKSEWIPCCRTKDGTVTYEEERLVCDVYMGHATLKSQPAHIRKLCTDKAVG